jgi:hypothetical protein
MIEPHLNRCRVGHHAVTISSGLITQSSLHGLCLVITVVALSIFVRRFIEECRDVEGDTRVYHRGKKDESNPHFGPNTRGVQENERAEDDKQAQEHEAAQLGN